MPPHSILAVTDFSQRGNHALSRAALLGAEHGATIKIIYFAQPGEPPVQDAAIRLEQHALQLSQRHGIRARAASRRCFHVENLLPEVRCADLIVWGIAPARDLRSFFLGEPVEQILRTAKRPVLIVQRAATHDYTSLIVAVDFNETSRRLVDTSFAFSKGAQVELFHAVSTAYEGKLRYAEVSARAIHAYRSECRRYAYDKMFWLTDSYKSKHDRVLSAIGHGDAARQTVARQQNSGAELIVVGRHPSSRLRDLFLGSTANRILGLASTDVLVVPHDCEPASGATAGKRLSSDAQAVRRVRAGAPTPPHLPDPAAILVGAASLPGERR
ncbi:MAG: universal stress protein [Variovorax sp.]|nr:universal stress protein [Variovorax sp.]